MLAIDLPVPNTFKTSSKGARVTLAPIGRTGHQEIDRIFWEAGKPSPTIGNLDSIQIHLEFCPLS